MQSSAAANSNEFLKFFRAFLLQQSGLKGFRWLHLLLDTNNITVDDFSSNGIITAAASKFTWKTDMEI